MSIKQLAITGLLLGFCVSHSFAQQTEQLTLRGTVATPSELWSDGFVSISGSKILQVGPISAQSRKSTVVETDSFIFPGLIDLHNHITWNLFPRWKPNELFSNRYEWQQRKEYKAALV